MMNIALIDNDFVSRDNHNFPNLALMKISAYHKNKGDNVKLIGFNEIDPNTYLAIIMMKLLYQKRLLIVLLLITYLKWGM